MPDLFGCYRPRCIHCSIIAELLCSKYMRHVPTNMDCAGWIEVMCYIMSTEKYYQQCCRIANVHFVSPHFVYVCSYTSCTYDVSTEKNHRQYCRIVNVHFVSTHFVYACSYTRCTYDVAHISILYHKVYICCGIHFYTLS